MYDAQDDKGIVGMPVIDGIALVENDPQPRLQMASRRTGIGKHPERFEVLLQGKNEGIGHALARLGDNGIPDVIEVAGGLVG